MSFRPRARLHRGLAYREVLPGLKFLDALANVAAGFARLLQGVVHALPQTGRVLFGAENGEVVGQLAVVGEQRLELALELRLQLPEGRVIAVATGPAGLQAGKTIVRHCRM